MRGWVLAGILAVVAVFAAAGGARADLEHRVRSGQSLARIAKRYHVTVRALAAANRIQPNTSLREGTLLRVPEPGEIFVAPNENLARIARTHGVEVDELARANRLQPTAQLQIGQRLILPGFEASRSGSGANAGPRWGRPRTPGVGTFTRYGVRDRIRIRLVASSGVVPRRSIQRLRELMLPRGQRRGPDPDRRLLQLLARISDHFGGRVIHIASGVRDPGGYTRESSRHISGDAIDFRIQGVPNRDVRDFIRRFDSCGVGYYPNSTFVHLDVRDRTTYWVDESRPGEAPAYRRGGEVPEEHGEAGGVAAEPGESTGATGLTAPAPAATPAPAPAAEPLPGLPAATSPAAVD